MNSGGTGQRLQLQSYMANVILPSNGVNMSCIMVSGSRARFQSRSPLLLEPHHYLPLSRGSPMNPNFGEPPRRAVGEQANHAQVLPLLALMDLITSQDITTMYNPQCLRSKEKQTINFIYHLKSLRHKSKPYEFMKRWAHNRREIYSYHCIISQAYITPIL